MTKVGAIKPDKAYSLREIRDEKLIPWALHIQTLRRIINDDLSGENLLQADRKGAGRQTRYIIWGDRIIRYINKYALDITKTARPKHNGKQNRKRRSQAIGDL